MKESTTGFLVGILLMCILGITLCMGIQIGLGLSEGGYRASNSQAG